MAVLRRLRMWDAHRTSCQAAESILTAEYKSYVILNTVY